VKKILVAALVAILAGVTLSACSTGAMSRSSTTAWRVSTTVNGGGRLATISCPTTQFCVAANGTGAVQTVNGGATWTNDNVDDKDVLYFVSCSKSTDCWAISSGKGGSYQYFMKETANATWTQATTRVLEIEPTAMTAISCPTTSECVAVGVATLIGGNASGYPVWVVNIASGADHANATWKKSIIPFQRSSITQGLAAVSCPTAKVCYTIAQYVEDDAILLRTSSSGSTWSTISIANGMTMSTQSLDKVSFSGISCPTTLSCTIAGSTSRQDLVTAHTSNGGRSWRWKVHPHVRDLVVDALEPSVSCPTISVCVVTDGHGFLRTNDGGVEWVRQNVPPGEVPFYVSCPSVTRCFADASKAVVKDGLIDQYGKAQILSYTSASS
jgi:hypothetical protein